jgi:hypothetical protein
MNFAGFNANTTPHLFNLLPRGGEVLLLGRARANALACPVFP